MKNFLLAAFLLIINLLGQAQSHYWQQHVAYNMVIDMDVTKHQFTGKQSIEYTNNSTDTLHRVFYHLYFNAFQPGSMMDERSRNLPDPDRRIGNRINELKPEEYGYHIIDTMLHNGKAVSFEVKETILEVKLNEPILPGQKSVFDMQFHSQVPKQIRRSGRMNSEGIDYSMSQWYPKLAEYDIAGWHPTPYIAREYYGVWGNYNVVIRIDSAYMVAATGVLQNSAAIGKGYADLKTPQNSKKLTWNFRAENVHDFVWAADPDYLHTKRQMNDGPELHFFYQNDTSILKNWEELPEFTERCFNIMKDMVGAYPYPVYSVIQGGDGGMEYPMATLILGTGKREGLIGVTVHEAIHSWFQGVLANNEGNHPWMDEGFDTYYDHLVSDSLLGEHPEFPHRGSYSGYFRLLEAGQYEPLSTHSDHYSRNRAYGVASYAMGCVLLNELNYIMGKESFNRAMKRYFATWKFKHPSPNDFMRIMEKESGLELDWFFQYFIYSAKSVDYGIEDVNKAKESTEIVLINAGSFPMPLDVVITLDDGQVMRHTIPLFMMFGNKSSEGNLTYTVEKPWRWTHPKYTFNIPVKRKKIATIEIDPTRRMADINRKNNSYPEPKE